MERERNGRERNLRTNRNQGDRVKILFRRLWEGAKLTGSENRKSVKATVIGAVLSTFGLGRGMAPGSTARGMPGLMLRLR